MAIEMISHKLSPSPEWEGKRLAEVLAAELPELSSRNRVLVVANGLVSRDGRVMADLDAVMTEEGGELDVDLRHGIGGEGEPSKPALARRMRVVYEDQNLVVVDKAPGITVQPEDSIVDDDDDERGRPLIELLRHYWRAKNMPQASPTIVQRLDRDTSGLLVIAKSVPAARYLQKDLADRRTKRVYHALVAGHLDADSGTWRSMLGRGIDGRRQSIAAYAEDSVTKDEDGTITREPRVGQDAITHYTVIGRGPSWSMLELDLETGRTHQLRIHCAEAGHPILGDVLYRKLAERTFKRVHSGKLDRAPSGDHPYVEAIRAAAAGQFITAKDPAGRLCLHATRLTFRHPDGGKRMDFESDTPFRTPADVKDSAAEVRANERSGGATRQTTREGAPDDAPRRSDRSPKPKEVPFSRFRKETREEKQEAERPWSAEPPPRRAPRKDDTPIRERDAKKPAPAKRSGEGTGPKKPFKAKKSFGPPSRDGKPRPPFKAGKPFKPGKPGEPRPFRQGASRDKDDAPKRPFKSDSKPSGPRPFKRDGKPGAPRPFRKSTGEKKEGGFARPAGDGPKKEWKPKRSFGPPSREGGDRPRPPFKDARKAGGAPRPFRRAGEDKKEGGGGFGRPARDGDGTKKAWKPKKSFGPPSREGGASEDAPRRAFKDDRKSGPPSRYPSKAGGAPKPFRRDDRKGGPPGPKKRFSTDKRRGGSGNR